MNLNNQDFFVVDIGDYVQFEAFERDIQADYSHYMIKRGVLIYYGGPGNTCSFKIMSSDNLVREFNILHVKNFKILSKINNR